MFTPLTLNLVYTHLLWLDIETSNLAIVKSGSNSFLEPTLTPTKQ